MLKITWSIYTMFTI